MLALVMKELPQGSRTTCTLLGNQLAQGLLDKLLLFKAIVVQLSLIFKQNTKNCAAT
jgi:hypothetical protein